MFATETKARGKRLAEFAQVLRAAWSEDRFSFQGEHYSYDDIAVTPKPPVPPRLWLGGSADAALERAARHADGYFPPSTQGGEALIERAEAIMRAREKAGAGGPFSFGAFVPVGLGNDADDGWAAIRDGVLHVRGSYLLWAQSERDVSGARAAAAAFEEQVRAGCITGTPAEVADTIGSVAGRIEAMGFDEVFLSAILAPPGTEHARATEAVERYAREVITALR
jgi:alkanesulfonate monooxygenase SsuD/methylene tetrahydromethanopterin reductase-like flavin-dependent oxidoreductase (luciferase family)